MNDTISTQVAEETVLANVVVSNDQPVNTDSGTFVQDETHIGEVAVAQDAAAQ